MAAEGVETEEQTALPIAASSSVKSPDVVYIKEKEREAAVGGKCCVPIDANTFIFGMTRFLDVRNSRGGQ